MRGLFETTDWLQWHRHNNGLVIVERQTDWIQRGNEAKRLVIRGQVTWTGNSGTDWLNGLVTVL